MTLTNAKAIVTKAIMATVAAGALLFAAPSKSQAQVFVGLRFGRPAPIIVARAYPAPYVAPYGFYARRGVIIRHDEWLRAHRFYR